MGKAMAWVTPGVDAVLEEISASYTGPVTVTQDLTVFNVTREAVTARQAKVNDAAPPVHGPSQASPALDRNRPPALVGRSTPRPLLGAGRLPNLQREFDGAARAFDAWVGGGTGKGARAGSGSYGS